MAKIQAERVSKADLSLNDDRSVYKYKYKYKYKKLHIYIYNHTYIITTIYIYIYIRQGLVPCGVYMPPLST